MEKKLVKFGFGKYIKKHWVMLVFYCLLLSTFYIASVFSTFMIAKSLSLLTENDYWAALLYMGYSTIAIVSSRLINIITQSIYRRFVRIASKEMMSDITNRVLKISSQSYSDNSAGSFVSRITSSPSKMLSQISRIINIIGGISASLFTMIYIMCINNWVGFSVVMFVLLLWLWEKFRINMYEKNKKITKAASDDASSLANEIVRSEKDIKSLHLEDTLMANANDIYGNFRDAMYKRDKVDFYFWTARNIMMSIFTFLLILFSIFILNDGLIAVDSFLFIFMNRGSIGGVVGSLAGLNTTIADIKVENRRIQQLFDDEIFPCEKFGTKMKDDIKGNIEFKDVVFGYALSQYDSVLNIDRVEQWDKKKKKKNVEAEKKTIKKNVVLDKISFKVEAGSTVAFVGRSGSGKSTILSLIPKLYEVEEGQVLIDGEDVKELSKETLRENISLVNQFPYIFNASIKDNLLMANKSANDEEIIDALKKASLYSFVETLEKGLDTLVGENGVKLSGGQKQRLAIARALLRNSPIILFDESTSSLDNFAQEDVRKSIEALQGGKTVVIVAHRLSTIKKADVIFFLENGKIVAQGTFDQLFENESKFREMFIVENI